MACIVFGCRCVCGVVVVAQVALDSALCNFVSLEIESSDDDDDGVDVCATARFTDVADNGDEREHGGDEVTAIPIVRALRSRATTSPTTASCSESTPS